MMTSIQTSRTGMDKHATQVQETTPEFIRFLNFLLNESNMNNKFPDAILASGKQWLEEYPPKNLKIV
ncbi:MAG: hypothetical protein R3C11_18755 [Planctomycetaceae bacterium]